MSIYVDTCHPFEPPAAVRGHASACHRHRQRFWGGLGRRYSAGRAWLARPRSWNGWSAWVGARACWSRMASPSTGARPSSPRPSCSRSFGNSPTVGCPTIWRCKHFSPFYRIRFDDGDEIACSSDPEWMRREVCRISPSDLDGYERFMAKAAEICRLGFEELGDQPFDSVADMARIVPDMLRLEGYRSVHGLVSKHVRHPKLRTMLSFHPLLVGGNPFRAPAIYCLIPALERRWGVHYPMGGVGRLVEGLAVLVTELGGTVRTHAEVARIETEGQKVTGVRLSTGERISADIVVSNADATATRLKLLEPSAVGVVDKVRMSRARFSMGVFVWYFGVRGRYETVGHHSILLGPRYRELLADIFDRKRLADDFSVYLHRPSATDASVAPEGCDAFYALCPVPNLDGATDWQEGGRTPPRGHPEAARRDGPAGSGRERQSSPSHCSSPH